MNITDVGHMVEGEADKMMEAANRLKVNKKDGRVPDGAIEDPNDPYQIADYFMDAFLDDGRRLGYKVAYEHPQNVPRATDHVEGPAGMIGMIEKLLDKGHAYVAQDGVVYYSVESFPAYGSLSGNTLENILSGAGGRVEDANQSQKKHPGDFMLWKPDQHHIMKWDSPFPHHECEIAQSCGTTGEDHFAKFWIHARFLFVEGEKMSKSLGNFYTARDVFDGKVLGEDKTPCGKTFHPSVLRYELIKSHYRSNMNFTLKGLLDSQKAIGRLVEFRSELESKTGGESAEVDLSHPVLSEFTSALADDLNISGALGVMHPWVKGDHPDPQESLAVWKKMNSVLSIAPINEGTEGAVEEAPLGPDSDALEQAQQWAREMDAARKEKDWAKSDALRDKIQEAGFEVQQGGDGGSTIK